MSGIGCADGTRRRIRAGIEDGIDQAFQVRIYSGRSVGAGEVDLENTVPEDDGTGMSGERFAFRVDVRTVRTGARFREGRKAPAGSGRIPEGLRRHGFPGHAWDIANDLVIPGAGIAIGGLVSGGGNPAAEIVRTVPQAPGFPGRRDGTGHPGAPARGPARLATQHDPFEGRHFGCPSGVMDRVPAGAAFMVPVLRSLRGIVFSRIGTAG